MNPLTRLFFATLLLILPAFAPAAEHDVIRFTGTESGRTGVFEMSGPWLLDWSTRNSSGLQPNFEIRLYAEDGGEFVGTIAQLQGVGRGLKLFEDTGRFQIEVVAQNLIWELLVKPVDPETAASLKRASDGVETLEDAAAKALRRLPVNSFASWRAVDERTLLLFTEDETEGFRVTFAQDCPGLTAAGALSFVTARDSKLDFYDSILLEDGTRCYFGRVMPTIFE